MNKMVKNSFVKTMLDELFNCNFQPKTISVRDAFQKLKIPRKSHWSIWVGGG